MRISFTGVSVEDQEKALKFYTNILGFVKKHDIPLGEEHRWLTVVSPEAPDGVELLLEPSGDYAPMKALKQALVADGIPYTTFEVDDTHAEYARLKALGVEFVVEPVDAGTTISAIFDDTCGNLIQIHQVKDNSG